MNKMLIAIFNTEADAERGLQALRKLHGDGDITLYATGVLVKDAQGLVSIKKSTGQQPVGAATGLALGGLIGLLAGPIGMAVGAVSGTVAGAIRDFWVAGVGLDFVEEAGRLIQPGKVALVAEIEEEWVTPLDSALEAAGAQVFRRSRGEVAQTQLDHDVAGFKTDILALQAEAASASGAAQARLQTRLAEARAGLEAAVERARLRLETIKQEADAKADSLAQQLSQAHGEAKIKLEARMTQVKSAYHARGVKLSQAWRLAKEAVTG